MSFFKELETKSKLAELRKKWLATTDPIMRKVIERQGKLLKLALKKSAKTV